MASHSFNWIFFQVYHFKEKLNTSFKICINMFKIVKYAKYRNKIINVTTFTHRRNHGTVLSVL